MGNRSTPAVVGARSPSALDYVVPLVVSAVGRSSLAWIVEDTRVMEPAGHVHMSVPWWRRARSRAGLTIDGASGTTFEFLTRTYGAAAIDIEIRTTGTPLVAVVDRLPSHVVDGLGIGGLAEVPAVGSFSQLFLMQHGVLGHGSWYLPSASRGLEMGRVYEYVEYVEPLRPTDWRRSAFSGSRSTPSGSTIADFLVLERVFKVLQAGLPAWGASDIRKIPAIADYCYGRSGTSARSGAAKRFAQMLLHADDEFRRKLLPDAFSDWLSVVGRRSALADHTERVLEMSTDLRGFSEDCDRSIRRFQGGVISLVMTRRAGLSAHGGPDIVIQARLASVLAEFALVLWRAAELGLRAQLPLLATLAEPHEIAAAASSIADQRFRSGSPVRRISLAPPHILGERRKP